MAKEEINEAVANEATEKVEKAEKPKKEKSKLVELEIPISAELQDDWVCIINGKTTVVQRGKKVMVDPAVKEVYENQKRMTELSIMRSRALQQKVLDKEKAFS